MRPLEVFLVATTVATALFRSLGVKPEPPRNNLWTALRTLVIAAGLCIAVYELYWSDRREHTEFERRSFEIASGFYATQELLPFLSIGMELNNPDAKGRYERSSPSEKRAIERRIMEAGFPIVFKITQVEIFIDRGLCSPEAVLGMTCRSITVIVDELYQMQMVYRNISQLRRRALPMVKKCEDMAA